MTYTVAFAPAAARQFEELPPNVQLRLRPRIDALGGYPHPPGSEALAGEEGLYRIRVRDYRVIYAVENQELIILVVKVGHRREIYRRSK